MIATLDRLYALDKKLEDLQSRILLDSLSEQVRSGERKAMAPIIFDMNEAALLRRLSKEYIEEAEEVIPVGQLQNY
jgi:hypothetical protein